MNDADDTRPDSDIVPTADSMIGRALEKYADNAPARAFLLMLATVMQVIPEVGQFFVLWGVLDFFASSRGQEIGAKRTQRLIESVGREVAGLRAGALRREYFESEEWHDLFRRAMEANGKVRDELRRDAIARVLIAAATDDIPPAGEPESLVAVLAEMSENEAILLGVLWGEWESENDMPPYHDWEAELLPPSVAPQGEFLLRRLVGRGLLVMAAEGRPVTHGREEKVYIDEYLGFSETGAALMRYLEANRPAPTDAPPT